MKKLFLISLACLSLGFTARGQVITTIAGNGTWGFSGDGGPATAAAIEDPFGVAVDRYGNVYIADFANNRIRKVNDSGVISTFAGTGAAGHSGDGGPATGAAITAPHSVAADTAGHIYFSEGSYVRVVNCSGIINTFAGGGSSGLGDGGPATAAALYIPWGVAIDGTGNVYITEAGNSRVRIVDSSGIINTFAGNGTNGYAGDGVAATNTTLYYPTGVAVDRNGNVYIADLYNYRIRKVNLRGVITTVAGNGSGAFRGSVGDGGQATAAGLFDPYSVTIDRSGNMYIAEEGNSRVRKVDSSGIITTLAGTDTFGYSGDGGPATDAQLYYPVCVAVDTNENIYIADQDNGRIRKVTGNTIFPTITGSVITSVPGLKVFPNPANAIINISMENATREIVTFCIDNMAGKEVLSFQGFTNTIITLNPHLPSGAYIISTSINGEGYAAKIFINY